MALDVSGGNDTSIVNVLVTLVAIALVDKIGRKPLLVIGSAGMAITLGAMAWCFSQATGSGADMSLPGAVGMVALAEISLTFAYGLYAGFALLSLFFVLYAVRETKGVELEDMHA